MTAKEDVYKILKARGVVFETVDHPAAHTIDDIEAFGVTAKGEVAKNLFLRDQKGRRHFLVTLQKDKKADLAALGEKLGAGKLSFASEERLMKYLGLTKGAVTPFGLLNDTGHTVEMVFDKTLTGCERLGIHPCDNTATVFLPYTALTSLISELGNPVTVLAL
ncbi:MAG: prolyl-tRNA synthetase associated domain-containing protein [Oscillospiraceae bacterium]|nr:prolyl-tRNA synthetase associated domain-containing protein [Oscillospiraceae bacterium]